MLPWSCCRLPNASTRDAERRFAARGRDAVSASTVIHSRVRRIGDDDETALAQAREPDGDDSRRRADNRRAAAQFMALVRSVTSQEGRALVAEQHPPKREKNLCATGSATQPLNSAEVGKTVAIRPA